MRQEDLSLFRSPLLLDEPLRFAGRLRDEHLHEGLLCAGPSVVGYVEDGVASLTAPNRNWSDAEITELRRGNYIQQGWDYWRQAHLRPVTREFLSRYTVTEGPVLEVACGPGGGLAPRALLANPRCRIVMNDLSIRVLQLQRAQTVKEGVGAEVMFVAYDATQRVLRPETIQAVSSFGGFGNIAGIDAAVAAAYDALVPGGVLYLSELDCETDEYRALPSDIKQTFDLSEGWRSRLERLGFTIEVHETAQGELMDNPEDGELVKTVLERGITLHKHHVFLIARKPDTRSV